MSSIKGKAMFQIVIFVIIGILANVWTLPGIVELSFRGGVLTLFLFFLITLKKVNSLKKSENQAYSERSFDETTSVCITTVCKNEGNTIINAVNHYMSFSETVKFVLYDDCSTDGTYEQLKKLSEKFGDRFVLKKLKKRAIQIHPKAFAIEDAFNTVDCDYFLVIDSDTLITREDFERAISAMKNRSIDVLHITRRNNSKNTFSYSIADKEEVMNMGLQILNIQPANFPGSGYFVSSEIVKGFKYDEKSLSEDNYLFKRLKKRTRNIQFFLTLFASERAPETFMSFIRQRINWLNMGIPYYLAQEFLFITMGNVLFSFMFFALFNPVSVGFLMISLCVAIVLGMELAMTAVITKENPVRTTFYTLCYLLIIGYIMGAIYFYLQIMTALGKNSKVIKKNITNKKEIPAES